MPSSRKMELWVETSRKVLARTWLRSWGSTASQVITKSHPSFRTRNSLICFKWMKNTPVRALSTREPLQTRKRSSRNMKQVRPWRKRLRSVKANCSKPTSSTTPSPWCLIFIRRRTLRLQLRFHEEIRFVYRKERRWGKMTSRRSLRIWVC